MTRRSEDLCERLDDFLNGDLTPQEAAEFSAHLGRCPACREAVDQQSWIDGLLRSDEAAALEAAPQPVAVPIAKLRRRRVLALAAAAAATTAALFIPLPRREGLGEGRPTVAKTRSPEPSQGPEHFAHTLGPGSGDRAIVGNPSPSPSLPGRGNEAATFVGDGSSIAISVDSDDPQVTIVQLYPTVTAARRWAREVELRDNALSPNGG